MKILDHITLVRAYRMRNEPESMREFADTFWHFIVVVCTLLTLAIATYSFVLFLSVNTTISDTKQTSKVDKPIFDKNALHAIVEAYEARSAYHLLYTQSAPTIADPSK